MASFDKLKVGDILYECRRTKMGNTHMSQLSCWTVVVKEIDPVKRTAVCSWNGNTAKTWTERNIGKLRRSRPKAAQ